MKYTPTDKAVCQEPSGDAKIIATDDAATLKLESCPVSERVQSK